MNPKTLIALTSGFCFWMKGNLSGKLPYMHQNIIIYEEKLDFHILHNPVKGNYMYEVIRALLSLYDNIA